MAGNYMDAPAQRVAYDRDGTVVVVATTAGLLTQLNASQISALNSETELGFPNIASFNQLALIFPIPLDLKAIFFSTPSTDTVLWTFETSKDTTTGLDGTWTVHSAALGFTGKTVRPGYRLLSSLTLPTDNAAATKIRGLRVRLTVTSSSVSSLKALHVYADPSVTATTDRLSFWNPAIDEVLPPAYFDWGNVPRGSSADKSFRIKNLSSSLTANELQIYVEALTPGAPTVSGMHTISDNAGATFLNSVTIASLDPGEISGVLLLRRVVPSNALVSVWSARVAVDVTLWN